MDVRIKNNVQHTEESCRPIRGILDIVGDKWSLLLIGILAGGTKRFSELHHSIEGISQRMLTRTLRELERCGLVTRTVKPTVPPSVYYDLTQAGRALLEPAKGLMDWARANYDYIESAKAEYDSRQPPR